MRYLRYIFLFCLGLVLVALALANREPVTLRILTDDVARFWNISNAVTLPLFLILFGAMIVGILIGFVWEWFREMRHRTALSVNRAEKDRLAREVDRLKSRDSEGQDEIIALLDSAAARK